MEPDISALSLDELKALKKKVERQIAGWEERKRGEALAAAEEAARSHGFNLSELGLSNGRRGRSGGRRAAIPLYANPDDPAQTWVGRGRRPDWVNKLIAAGHSLDDLKI